MPCSILNYANKARDYSNEDIRDNDDTTLILSIKYMDTCCLLSTMLPYK